MKKGCPHCLPGPNNACPEHKGGPGRGKRKRMKKLSYEQNRQAGSFKTRRDSIDSEQGPTGSDPARRDNPGRNKCKRLKKLNYEANNERVYQAKVALERDLDVIEGRMSRGACHKTASQNEPSPDSAPTDTASKSGAQCLDGISSTRRGNPGRNKRKRLKKLNYEANNERVYQARVALERDLDILEGRVPRGACHKSRSQDESAPYDLTAPANTASISGAQNAATGGVLRLTAQQPPQELPDIALDDVLQSTQELDQDDVRDDIQLDVSQGSSIGNPIGLSSLPFRSKKSQKIIN
jgi:hypothetical protein